MVSQENKCEKRGREPATLFQWKKACFNQVKVFGLVLGKEHTAERFKCLDMLEKAHEDNERAFPFAYICRLWNELWAVWIEELRESRRHLTRILNTDQPRKEELKGLALMPGPDGAPTFSFPNTFDLEDPAGYYQQVCVPQQSMA